MARLLHDLGKIPLNTLFSSEYRGILDALTHDSFALYKIERKVIGIDHMRVGKMIGDKWKPGGMIRDCLYHHHDPDRSDEENIEKVQVIALADMLSKSFGFSADSDFPPDREAIQYLINSNGLYGIELDDLRGTVSEEIDKAQVFLQLTAKG